MAKRTVTTEFKVSEEDKYKKAVSEINAGLRVLNSEMKKTTAEYASNAKSVEALKEKGDVLERTLLSQKEKVEKLKEALKWAVGEYGEANEATMKWQTSLNNAEAEVAKTENKIRKNNEAIEDAQKGILSFATESKGMGEILDSIASKFGVSIPSGVTESLNSFASFSVAGVGAITAVISAVKGLIDVEKKLVDMTTQSASSADNILTMSQITGLDTETIQEMQYASELIDVSFETIKGSMTKMKRNMDSARDGNEDLTKSFEDLGVAITDATTGKLRNAEDVFYDAIDALGQIQDATERDAVAMEIFGKSAEELNPLIIQGTDTLRDYAEEAHNVNAVLTEEQLASLGAVDDAYQRLQETQDAIKDQMSVEMAPAVESLYTNWTQFIQDAGEALVDSGILKTLSNILEIVSNMIPLFESILQTTIPSLGNGIDNIGEKIDSFNLKIAYLLDLISTINPYNFSENISRLVNGGTYASTQYTESYKSTRYVTGNTETESGLYTGNYVGGGEVAGQNGVFNASGSYNFKGGYTWVGESGAELVKLPTGSQIYNSQDSRSMGGDTFNISINASDVKEFNDIVNIVKNSRRTTRMRA